MTPAWAIITMSVHIDSSISSIVETLKSGIKVNKFIFFKSAIK